MLSHFYSYSVIVGMCSFLLTFFFSCSVKKRNHFALRVSLSVLAVYFALVGTSAIPRLLPFLHWTTITYAASTIYSALAVYCCFQMKFVAALFLSFAAYTCRHMIYLVTQMFYFMLADLIPDLEISIYIQRYVFGFAFYVFFSPLLLGLYQVIKNNKGIFLVPPLMTLVISGLAILVDIIFNCFSLMYFNYQEAIVKYWMNTFNVILCIMTLIIMFGYARQVNIQSQIAVMNQLEYERNRQFDLSKQNIEMINVKCHDLRHQLRTLESISDPKIQKELADIEDKLRIYDTRVKTGNKTLDILLSEKSLFCHKNNVILDCIIDGKQIDFLSQNEITSLFGNIVDNAIESMLKIKNEKKRIITLKIFKSHGGVYITEDNPYEGELNVKGGRILTDKKDSQYHGFGLVSIKKTVDRYDGVMKITTDDGIFRLQIFFPTDSCHPS